MDFTATLVVLVLICSAAFVIRSLPIWIWPLLAICLMGIGDSPAAKFLLSSRQKPEPKSHREACTQACDEVYGGDSRYFITRDVCIERCSNK